MKAPGFWSFFFWYDYNNLLQNDQRKDFLFFSYILTYSELKWEAFKEWLPCEMTYLSDTVLVKEMNSLGIVCIPWKGDILLL